MENPLGLGAIFLAGLVARPGHAWLVSRVSAHSDSDKVSGQQSLMGLCPTRKL